jgi:ABC-type sulfate transport system permease component
MEPMPAIHTVSVIHLCLVAAFLGLYMSEAVVEGSLAKDDLHPTAIRVHFFLDVFVEIPLMVGIAVTGIILSLLVEEITNAHAWLIACGTIVVLSCIACFLGFVRTRRKLLDREVIDHERLAAIRKKFGIVTFAILNPALIAALILGFWLAHQRAVEAFRLG